MAQVYLNGAFLPLEEARIPVMDRGFLFGDGVYEVIPVYGGRLFRLAHHLERLDNSLRGIRLQPPLTHAQWAQVLQALTAQLPDQDQSVYLQVTRGPAATRDHRIPEEVRPTLFAMTRPVHPADAGIGKEGVAALTTRDIRWQMCDVKAITLLANVLLREQAADAGAMEAILVRDGLAVEGAASNLFIVQAGRIVTPPKSRHLLPGITRDLVLELAAEHALPHAEADIPAAALESAGEIWLTSSSREVMPVTQLDGKPVANGRPGPMWKEMNRLFQEYKLRPRRSGAA